MMHTFTVRILAVVALCTIAFFPQSLSAHDDGQYAASPLKAWFDKDVDWDTQGNSYRVRINGQWVVVPDAAVVTEPNKFGPAVVWPYQDFQGATQIRCFLPGTGA
jgi:hypothetical protein